MTSDVVVRPVYQAECRLCAAKVIHMQPDGELDADGGEARCRAWAAEHVCKPRRRSPWSDPAFRMQMAIVIPAILMLAAITGFIVWAHLHGWAGW
jgi:hypothetical protein